jgi:DNA-binding NtrC family response regulator
MTPFILIAAHDPWFLQLLRIYTEESGFQALQVYEGQDVLPVVQQERPVAVLLQLDLPGHVKGLEVLHALHGDHLVRGIPVLLFTWHDQALPPEALGEVSAHLQEPVTFEVFLEALYKVGLNPVRQHPARTLGRSHSLSGDTE